MTPEVHGRDGDHTVISSDPWPAVPLPHVETGGGADYLTLIASLSEFYEAQCLQTSQTNKNS